MHLKDLRTERVSEFISDKFKHYHEEHGIWKQLTAPYLLQQNGVVEKQNQTVVEMARIMMMLGLYSRMPTKILVLGHFFCIIHSYY